MLTRTRTYKEKKSDLEKNHSFSIPQDIEKTIKERWFYLYEWIWAKDVKNSIERDYLKYLSKLWTFFSLLLIIPSAILFFIIWPLVIFFFIWVLFLINAIFLIILSILSIKRSVILRKNSNIILTDKYISINWKIEKLNNIKYDNLKDIKNISTLFEEEIFNKSNIQDTKKWLFKKVIQQIWTWYKRILTMWRSRSKNSAQLLLIMLALYTLYAISLWSIYFIWIFFIWLLWNILSFINKKILIATWHKITMINENFENIDEYSKLLVNEKNKLSTQLKEANNNNWQDWLLNKINDWLENINKYADNSLKTYIKLKHDIDNSDYKEMFNYSIYNSWVKNQILFPIEQIIELLNKNLSIIVKNKENIEKQISDTNNQSHKWALNWTKVRMEMKIDEIQKHLEKLNLYANKLRKKV